MVRIIILLLLAFINNVNSCWGQVSDSGVTVYFKKSSSVLDRENREQLTKWLTENKPPVQLNLKGFTDTTGSSAYNRILSMARANAVANFIRSFSSNYSFTTIQGVGEDSLLNRSLLWQNRKVMVEIERDLKPYVPIKIIDTDSSDNKNNKRLERAEENVKRALENIYFVPDKPVLEEVSLYYLPNLTTALLQYPPTTMFEIVGHVHCLGKRCNDPGLTKINNELSTARAKEVYLHLIERGITARRLSYRGVGSQNLFYPHPKTEEEARKNMRVEIIVHQ